MSFNGEGIDNRTLVLCPQDKIASLIEENVGTTCNNITIFKSENIENSLEPFITKERSVLILSNRYDGIDLPDDTCRQLIIVGNPNSTNLQEKFLQSRLAIFSLVKDRIITRFTQATGRCTRGIRDYSLVVLIEASLHQFCLKKDNLEAMHPELQAEIKFGLENSNVDSIDKLSELVDLFFKQGADWKGADQEIKNLRKDCNISEDKRSKTLMEVVKDEVEFQYFLWKEDYLHALDSANKVVGKLSGALWYYFAGSISWQLERLHPKKGYEKLVQDYFDRAVNCIDTSSWFSDVALPADVIITRNIISIINIHASELIQRNIIKIGFTGKAFETKMDGINGLISDDTPSKFEEGLKQLGNLLGFESDHPSDQAAPDSVWQISDSLLILFEAKRRPST